MRPLGTVSWTLEFSKIKLSGPVLKAIKCRSIETQTRQEDWSDIPAYIQHTAQSAPQSFLPLYNPSTRSQRCFPSAPAWSSTWVGRNSGSDNVTTSERSWYQISRGVWEENGWIFWRGRRMHVLCFQENQHRASHFAENQKPRQHQYSCNLLMWINREVLIRVTLSVFVW